MMGMYFEFKDSLHNFLIYGWNTSTLSSFLVIIAVCFALALLIEAGRALHSILSHRANLSPLVYAKTSRNVAETTPLLRSLIIPTNVDQIVKRKIKYHIGMSLLHVAKVVVAYVVMLAVMSYNAWVFVTVVIGSALGYLIFGAIQHKITTADTPDTHVINNQDDMLGTHSQTSYEPIG
ncbi:probable low affinity copper uptake protein 2 isoform X2 [Lingula anatina]|uniref:Copper transport protein n=1 Tax=Lingula anatina TaxID=7574 RepID=A0A1S3I7E9_LINAN|nr:probable low affinity copper uptake protein 2 isoform X2 [Lingula anatina]|eukprot:XP_013394205.1 probable low affinity copper uptake protein 2 isoform X2 [Lingula anatina]